MPAPKRPLDLSGGSRKIPLYLRRLVEVSMKLADFIVKDAIIAELKSTERDSVIREMVQSLAAAKAIAPGDVDVIVKAIIDREKVGSTGFGKGVAVPHVKHLAIKKRIGVVGRSTIGVDFAALDQAPVYSVFLLLSPQ